jgi:serine/threonine-protein kinase
MSLAAGDMIGPYEILSPIGAGGMGEVWKARDTRLNRVVAIKWLKRQHSARFEQEARAIAALNHPNICQIHDIGQDYLVLEYIEGQPLRGPFSAEEGVRLGLQIVSALEEAHAKGILHRDLKPANILLNAKREAKLLDFGLAKLGADGESDATRTVEGTVLGTPAYMAPEQAQGKPLDARSDIFSFGTVLYEMLSGRRAFSAESPLSAIADIIHKEPEPLQASVDITRIIARCLRKSPSDRFQSATELRTALAAARVAATAEAHQSIAVLPFANMSRDADDEYFSDGLAEEIINALVKVPGLKVIARTSAFAFKGQNIDIRKIAETLGVTTVLEGSVRRAGNRIRVTAQLITAADGSHLWSERYDREMADVFAVQDEISAAISGALQVKLSPAAAAKHRYTPKLPAYEALLKAKHFHWKVTAESMEQAKGFYEQAIALDPQYALAQAAYADYLFGRTTVGMTPLREVAPTVRTLAERALELDPSLPEAHSTLGLIAAMHDYNWREFNRQLMLTIADDAASPHCHFVCALCLTMAGRLTEAVEHYERAVQADPLHLTIRNFMGVTLGGTGRHAEAEAHFRQVLSLDPNFFWSHQHLAELYAAQGRFEEALSKAEKAFSLAPWYAPIVGLYAGLLARAGRKDQARQIILGLGTGEKYGASGGFALFHLCCGDLDKAADWFEKAVEERDSLVGTSLRSAFTGPLRVSARWPKLAERMNLAELGSQR